MITNERQYRITKSQLSKLESAIEGAVERLAAVPGQANPLEAAQIDAMRSECEALATQILDYENLKSGAVSVFESSSLEELPSLLIRARISMGLSQKGLADRLSLKEQQIQRYESEYYASASLKRLVDVANALGLSISEIGELRQPDLLGVHDASDIDAAKFPIADMYKRGYFDDFVGSLDAARAIATELIGNLAMSVGRSASVPLLRQSIRAGSSPNRYALMAWQWRVLSKSKMAPAHGSYNRRALTPDWMRKIAQLSAQPDGPKLAQSALADAGVSLVVEPHMPGTHLDGAAFLGERGRPVIGLTLRYDRLDNFWFALLHELAHVAHHLRQGEIDQVYDDLEATPDAMEREADLHAGEALIPEHAWETSLARYLQSETSVIQFADEIGVGPCVVAGRIRHESRNFTLLQSLIGQGEVRRQFSEVRFG